MADEIQFDWDEANMAHIARHDVTPEEAQEALANEPVDVNYEAVEGEERWTSLGHTNMLRVLKVVWTLRGNAVRVVTVVEASRGEARVYLRAKTGKL